MYDGDDDGDIFIIPRILSGKPSPRKVLEGGLYDEDEGSQPTADATTSSPRGCKRADGGLGPTLSSRVEVYAGSRKAQSVPNDALSRSSYSACMYSVVRVLNKVNFI